MMKRSNNRRNRHEPSRRNKKNPLKAAGIEKVDYKDTNTLRQFISDRHKIRSRRVTGLSPKQQREVATAVKNAREMALLPFTSR
nr:30S ribosomal protein S18 [Corynebacterium otitidis]